MIVSLRSRFHIDAVRYTSQDSAAVPFAFCSDGNKTKMYVAELQGAAGDQRPRTTCVTCSDKI